MVTGGASASGATSLDSTEIKREFEDWEPISGRLPTLMRRFGLVNDRMDDRILIFGIIKSKSTYFFFKCCLRWL